MAVHCATVTCETAVQAENVADALEPTCDAVSWFEKEDGASVWIVSAYFDGETNDTALRETIANASGQPDLGAAAVIAPVPEQDWVAESQRLLPPVQAGGFVIHGSHDRDTVAQDDNAIEIEAGAAFGTAHHGTTTGCLEAVTTIAGSTVGGDISNVLYLGTGSAILAIAAERRWPNARILATDIDPVAIIVAEGNATLNRAHNIAFAVADGLDDNAISGRAPYDLVIANILAGPLIGLSKDICEAVVPDSWGRIILSGLLDAQAEDVISAYRANGFAVETHLSREGWSTLTLHRSI